MFTETSTVKLFILWFAVSGIFGLSPKNQVKPEEQTTLYPEKRGTAARVAISVIC
jgi:hypothetical protein